MLASALLLAALKPRLVLKPTRDPVTRTFFPYPASKVVAVWVDKRDTEVRISDWREDPKWALGFDPVLEFSNPRGDLAGEFNELYRGAMNGTYHHLFHKPKGGKFVLLPFFKGSHNPSAVGIDAKGRLLALDDPTATETGEISHAYLWTESKWIDLGAASWAKFNRDGSVIGSFPVNRDGRPLVPLDYGGDGFRVRFLWKDGKRTESRPYQA